MNILNQFAEMKFKSKTMFRDAVKEHLMAELQRIQQLQKELDYKIERAKLSEFILSILDS
jgi:hypothetical protein